MKPHDQWNSADIADYARRAMYLETQDYSDLPDPNLPPPNWEWRVYTVVCVALLVAVLVVVWRLA